MASDGAPAPVRWGILGCADIARKFCHGAGVAPNATIAAVASRSLDKAKAFAAENAPGATAYDSYEALLADPAVEAVYIPLPTGMRKEWVLKAARAKKHVDCEKPIATNFRDTEECIQTCKEEGVQFMDNTMLMHNSRTSMMTKVIEDGELGPVKHIVSAFSIPFGNDPAWASSNIRMNAATEPLGALGDLGWYCIRASLWGFGWELPQDVCCHILETTDDGVPITMHCLLRYSGGRSAVFDCSFKAALRQWVEVVGEKKTLSFDDLVVNQSLDAHKFVIGEASITDRAITFPKASEERTAPGCVQHANLIENMSAMIRKGELNPDWPERSSMTQRVLIACYASGKAGGAAVKPSDVETQ